MKLGLPNAPWPLDIYFSKLCYIKPIKENPRTLCRSIFRVKEQPLLLVAIYELATKRNAIKIPNTEKESPWFQMKHI